jgi:hypothetical protein
LGGAGLGAAIGGTAAWDGAATGTGDDRESVPQATTAKQSQERISHWRTRSEREKVLALSSTVSVPMKVCTAKTLSKKFWLSARHAR